MKKTNPHTPGRWPRYGPVGLMLVAIFWPINWHLPGLRTHWAFFPLWLGYILAVDAGVVYRQGHSLLQRNGWRSAGFFLLSAPLWWIFEMFNARVQYWIYTPIESFSRLEYYLYCTLNFSVVLPAVLCTAEWVSTWKILRTLPPGPRIAGSSNSRWLLFFLGWAMLVATLIWPRYGMAFLWMSLYFILDPINQWLGHPSLLHYTARGDWRPVLALWSGCLICGFFWELWNYYSSPKWIYQVPYVDFWHVFEMPLLGYLGYLPFALELYALYAFVMGRLGRPVIRFFEG